MVRLIYKDIVIQKKSLLLGLIYIVFFLAIFQEQPAMMYTTAVVAITYILVMGGFALDDQASADTFLNSLPVTRSKVVFAKYLSLLLFFFMATMAYALVHQLVQIVNLPILMGPITKEGVAGGLLSVSLINAIYFPVMIRIGYQKARIFNFIVFFGVFFGVSFLASRFREQAESQMLLRVEHFLTSQPDLFLYGMLFMVIAVLLAISCVFSLYFYKRRDF